MKTAADLADLAHRVASKARRDLRLAFDAAWGRFVKCDRCGSPYANGPPPGYQEYLITKYRCVCGGALIEAGYTPAPEVP